MWHFTDLTDAQKHERRALLDAYGAAAQLSVLVPLVALQVWFFVRWVRGRVGRGLGGYEVLSEVGGKGRRGRGVGGWFGRVRGWGRRVAWWLGGEVVEGGVFGIEARWGEVLGGVGWAAWLLVLCVVDTRGDYLHLTKRFGIVGASQIPLHYLLALKSPRSPLQYLTRCSWETLNALHQILGRIVTLLFYLHAGFYLNFFVQAHVLSKRIKDRDVILGLTATVAFTILGTTALHWIRRLNYRVFFTVHVTLATALLPILYFHVHHIRPYVWETLLIYTLHLTLRFFNERITSGTAALVPGTPNLLELRIPLSTSPIGAEDGKKKARALLRWHAGQHIYLSLPRGSSALAGPWRTKNPFTIASVPSLDRDIKLLCRVRAGATAALCHAATGDKSRAGIPIALALEGPYGLATHATSLLSYNKVLFIAGGVGASFAVPLYRTLLRDLSPSAGSRRRQNVTFVWCVRDAAETGWAAGDDEGEGRGMAERMLVYATRSGGGGAGAAGSEAQDFALASDDEEAADEEGNHAAASEALDLGADDDDDEDGVEMARLLPSSSGAARSRPVVAAAATASSSSSSSSRQSLPWPVRHGRPDLKVIVDQIFDGTSERERVAVVVCGPKGMGRAVRAAVGAWVGGREVWFWREEFGL